MSFDLGGATRGPVAWPEVAPPVTLTVPREAQAWPGLDPGVIRPTGQRLHREVAAPDRRFTAVAVTLALLSHAGLLAALLSLVNEPPPAGASIEIPVEIVVEAALSPAAPPSETGPAAPDQGEVDAKPDQKAPVEQTEALATPPGAGRSAGQPEVVVAGAPPAEPSPPTTQPDTTPRPILPEAARSVPPPPAEPVPPDETAASPSAPVVPPSVTEPSLASSRPEAASSPAQPAAAQIAPPPRSEVPPAPAAAPRQVPPVGRGSDRSAKPAQRSPPAKTRDAPQASARKAEALLAERKLQEETAAKLAAERSAAREKAAQQLEDRRRAQRGADAARSASAAPSEGEEEGRGDSEGYARGIVSRITAMKRYPSGARARGASGTVVVSFTIGSAGQITSAAVGRSSGDAELDTEAVATVRRAGPFGPPPRGAPKTYTVPLRYQT